MIYPKFIKENDLIGICAPSAGVGDKVEEFEASLANLKKEGFKISETESVRNNNERSTTSNSRAKEFKELVLDEEVKMVMFAAGGDYMLEMMDKVNMDDLKNHPKWLMGGSDPTNLTYPITTVCDIASFYGFNAGSFDVLNKDKKVALQYIKGNLIKQNSYKYYTSFLNKINDIDLKEKVKWVANKELNIKGRCIGGCLDVIVKLIGTPLDKTKEFIEKYKDDGIIWYFDNFAMNSYDYYLSLLQMKMAGYFKYCKGVLIGRVAFPKEENITYLEANKKALGNIPYIMEMDIGHSDPAFIMINGAIINVKYKDNKGSIKFDLV